MPRASPAKRVSLFAVAARHVVCKEEHKRSPPSNMCRSAMAVENMYGWMDGLLLVVGGRREDI